MLLAALSVLFSVLASADRSIRASSEEDTDIRGRRRFFFALFSPFFPHPRFPFSFLYPARLHGSLDLRVSGGMHTRTHTPIEALSRN